MLGAEVLIGIGQEQDSRIAILKSRIAFTQRASLMCEVNLNRRNQEFDPNIAVKRHN
jgi:hypothetical protein